MNSPLYLARAQVTYEVAAKRRFTSALAWHHAAWEAYDGIIPRRKDKDRAAAGLSPGETAPPDFLYRVEQKDAHVQMLLLSHARPQRPGWCPEPGWQVKPMPDSFFTAPRYYFSLLANPTVCRRETAAPGKRPRGSRTPVTEREALLSWLTRHGETAGFRPLTETVKTIARPRERFFKGDKAVTLHAVDFTGTIEVTDTARFRARYPCGLGSAKGYGFGLLAVAPIQ